MKSAVLCVLSLGLLPAASGCGNDVADVSRNNAPPSQPGSPPDDPTADETPAASDDSPAGAGLKAGPNASPGAWTLAKEYAWKHGQPAVKMNHRDDGIAFVTGVQGALSARAEVAVVQNPRGDWLLEGRAVRHELSGTAVAIPWFAEVERPHVFKSWTVEDGASRLNQIIRQQDGFCVLQMVGGQFGGSGEQYRLRVDDDTGHWRFNARSRGGSTRAKILVVRMQQPGSFDGVVREHHWSGGGGRGPVPLIHRDDGFAFLSGIGGTFAGNADYARVVRHEDGFWYLDGGASRGDVKAWAISIQLSKTLTPPPLVAANDLPQPPADPTTQPTPPKTATNHGSAKRKDTPHRTAADNPDPPARIAPETAAANRNGDDFYADLIPYVHHDFCAAVVIHPSRIAQSPLGKLVPAAKVLEALLQDADENIDPQQATQFVDPEKIHRLTVLLDPFPGGNVAFFPAVVVEYAEDTPGREMIRALFPDGRPAADDGRLFTGLDSMAGASVDAYVAGPRTILIAPQPTLEKMRSEFRSPRKPLQMQLGTEPVESEIIVEYTSKPALARLLELTGRSDAQLRADPETDEIVKTLLLDIASASLHLQLSMAQSIRADIRCADRKTAAALEETINTGMVGLTAMRENAELRKELPPPAREFVASAAMRDLLHATAVERKGTEIAIKLDFPESVLELVQSSVAQLVASTEPLRDDGEWIVIFRSADPAIWNTNVDEGPDRFATSLSRVPDGIKYLRLKVDAERFAVIEMTKDKLGKRSENGQIGWEGTNHLQWNGRHLGIYDRRWTDQVRGTIQILPLQNRGVRGWGFGNRTQIDDRQGYSWAGKELPKTVFEIAVKSGGLSAAEREALLE